MLEGLIVYQENKPKVKRLLKAGEIDYLDVSEWSFVDKFFGFLLGTKFFEWCATTYPSPRTKEEIPVWFLLSCGLQMKLHSTAAFHALPGILRSGSILTRVKFNIGKKDGGFNRKNKKERVIPVDQDTVRKYFKTSDSEKTMIWFNRDVMKWIRRHRGFDKAGIFLLDKTYLFVPDNSHYEGASLLAFDRHDNLVDTKKMTDEERKQVIWRYCYGLTTLLHVSHCGDEHVYIYAGAHLTGGKDSEVIAGKKLVDDFVSEMGKGVIKKIIMDRGFLDGEMIARWKKDYKIDSLIPLKKNMNARTDAIDLTRLEENPWKLYREEKNQSGELLMREEVAGFSDITSWDACEVPLYVAIMRRDEKGKEEQIWALASTEKYEKPSEAFDDYQLRTQIEERHRQFKACWWLTKFTSTAFSLISHHVLFTLLVYTLIQLYLSRKHLGILANKTIQSLRQEELLGTSAVIVYARNYYAAFDTDEYTIILLKLKEHPRQKLLKWVEVFHEKKIRAP